MGNTYGTFEESLESSSFLSCAPFLCLHRHSLTVHVGSLGLTMERRERVLLLLLLPTEAWVIP
jgi:hypothetical protein